MYFSHFCAEHILNPLIPKMDLQQNFLKTSYMIIAVVPSTCIQANLLCKCETYPEEVGSQLCIISFHVKSEREKFFKSFGSFMFKMYTNIVYLEFLKLSSCYELLNVLLATSNDIVEC